MSKILWKCSDKKLKNSNLFRFEKGVKKLEAFRLKLEKLSNKNYKNERLFWHWSRRSEFSPRPKRRQHFI